MGDSAKISLPDGEFFIMQDNRSFSPHFLSGRSISVPGREEPIIDDQYDRYPDLSEQISMSRLSTLRELQAKLGPSTYPGSLFDDRRAKFDSSLLSPESYFHGSSPPCEIHFDQLHDFAVEPNVDRDGNYSKEVGAYTLVSKEWNNAIEGLEPGVHEFFPHEVEFCNYTIITHFIFRDCQRFEFIDLESSVGPKGVQRSRTGELVFVSRPSRLVLHRTLVAGRHWMPHRELTSPVISRTLALRLLPLLPLALETPETFNFYPMLVK